MRALHAIADSGQMYGGRAFNDGLREAALHHVPVHVARCGERWATDDGVALSVLSPCGELFADGKNDVNENSVVVMLRLSRFSHAVHNNLFGHPAPKTLATLRSVGATTYVPNSVVPSSLTLANVNATTWLRCEYFRRDAD